MKIAIITAMSVEHEQIVALMSNTQQIQTALHTFTLGNIGQHAIILMQSGIGKVNATIGAVAMLTQYEPDLLLSTGVAGGIDHCLQVMDVVVSSQVAYHDVWCGEGNSHGQVQGLPLYFQGDCKAVDAAMRLNQSSTLKSRIYQGLICTGDQFITQKNDLEKIKHHFPTALAVDMESAALAHTCHLYGCPFVSFRIISDTPGASNHWEQYLNFWEEMAHRSFGVTQAFLHSL